MKLANLKHVTTAFGFWFIGIQAVVGVEPAEKDYYRLVVGGDKQGSYRVKVQELEAFA